ncbi:MAG: lysylphosphatidylglycerol synthase transmembrane domain-containing protein, partial [Terriglobia bacterium]
PLTVILRSVRWRWLLPAGGHLPLSSFIGAYLVGNLANSLLLGKFGDLVKAKLICDSKVDYGRSVTVVVIDRLFEGTALILIFAAVLLTSSLPGWAYELAWIAGGAAIGALVTLRIIFHHQVRFLNAAERVLNRLPVRWAGKLMVAVRGLVAGCEVLADYRRMRFAFLYALAVWGVEVLGVMAFLAAFSIPVPRLLAAVVLIVVVNLGMLVPITPGSVGVYQLLCAFALALWGVNRQVAFALGIAMQTVNFVPMYAAGLVAMLLLKRSGRTRATAAAVPEQCL